MFKNKVKLTLLSLALLVTVGCNNKRMIIKTPSPSPVTQSTRPVVVATPTPVIKEEILLGRNNTIKTPSLGSRVDVPVPVNNPSLGNSMEENLTVVERSNEIIERMTFPEDEYRYIKTRGSSTLKGKLYLENSHSSQKVAGKTVKLWLNPVTSYSRQWYQESFLGGYKLSKNDKRLFNYLKSTYSNNSGEFSFFGIASGEYYLTATMKCAEECGFSGQKSILLVRQVSVGRGTTRTDLTKNVP